MRPLPESLRRSHPTRRRRSAGQRDSPVPPAVIGLGLTLTLCPMWLGGVSPWAIVVTAICAAAVLGLVLYETPRDAAITSRVAPLMVLALAWTALQAMPLPCAFVEWLSPDAAIQLRRALALLGRPEPYWCTLTRDPGGTHAEVLKGCAIVCVYLAANLLVRQGQRVGVLASVAVACAVMALVALGHGVLGAEQVFGLYTPVQRQSSVLVLAPIINPNNLGGFVAMGVPVMLGLWDRRVGGGSAPLWVYGALLSILVVMLTQSRGAVVVVVFGTVAYLGARLVRRMLRRQRGDGRARDSQRLIAGVAASVGLGVAVALGAYVVYDTLAAELKAADLGKLQLIRAGAEFAARYPLFGVGRGAFSATFVAYAGSGARFEHAENCLVQWASEWGIPVALLLAAGFGRALWSALLRARDSVRQGAVLGLSCIAIQNQVDLGFELVGIAIGVAALAAAVFESSSAVGGRLALDSRRMGLGVLTATALATLGLGPWLDRDDAVTQARDLARLEQADDRAGFATRLSDAVRLHPSDPTFALAAAREATLATDPRAGRWISRTMELAPQWSQPHALAAAWLWSMGRRDQAVLELAETAERNMGMAGELACRIARQIPDKALQAVPKGPNRAAFLERLAACVPPDSEAALAVDRMLVEQFPDNVAPRLRLNRRLVQHGKVAQALADSAAFAASYPADARAQLGLVSVLEAAGRLDEAIAVCTRAAAKVQDGYPLVLRRMGLESAANRLDAMRKSAEELRRLSAGDPVRLADSLVALARFESAHANVGSALHAAQEAQRIDPSLGRLHFLAELLRKLGDRPGLFRVLSQICAIEVGGAACREREAVSRPVRP